MSELPHEDAAHHSPDEEATELESIRLILPRAVGWQLALFLAGVYAVMHIRFVLSSQYKRLSWRVRGVLWGVCVLLTLFVLTIAVQHDKWTVSTDHTHRYLYNGTWLQAFSRALNASVAITTQVVLTLRAAYMIRPTALQRTFVVVVVFLVMFEVASATLSALGVADYRYSDGAHIGPLGLEAHNATGMWLWTSAAVDLVISVSLAFSLKQRIAGFNKKTDTVLKKLIVGALHTATYTTILAILAASTSAAYNDLHPLARLPSVFIYPLPLCYGISLYTTLATRRTVENLIGMSPPPPASADISNTGGAGDLPSKLGGSGLPGLRVEERSWKTEEGGLKRPVTRELRVSTEEGDGRNRPWVAGGLLKGDLEDDSPV